ncbi:Receptor-type tyrosine-protein like [Quillaja saponaria]|uniref:Receptor-type tyrosine-protein like n=1 Tax=Quillaja saponaria TaxID=32244 RepID=A0AAD7PPE2_QUISA|nr:Receptor-type tyrosine-protein like [Quillaja saponaria]
MAIDHEEEHHHPTTQTHITPFFRWQTRVRILHRRRKLQTVRLGGKKPRRGFVLVKMWRKIRVRWLKFQYLCMLKKIKEYYKRLIKDLVEAGASIETFQQMVFMETSFAVPIGVSFSTYPHLPGSDRPRTLFM